MEQIYKSIFNFYYLPSCKMNNYAEEHILIPLLHIRTFYTQQVYFLLLMINTRIYFLNEIPRKAVF